MIDVKSRLADNIKEFNHKVEAVNSSVKQSVDICGHLNLSLS